MPGESTRPNACSEIVVASATINPAEARCVQYSNIKSFGVRARVSVAITARLRSASPHRSNGGKQKG